MSPRKAATATDRRLSKSARALKRTPPVKKTVTKGAGEGASPKSANGASVEAKQLAATIERDLREGRLDTLSKEAFQALMAALCKSYGTQLEAGADFLPVADRTSVSPTEIMSTTSGLLKAANLAVFELGMWQSWTGR